MCKTSCGKTSNHNTKSCSTIDPVNEGPCIRLHTPRTHPTARKVHLAVGTLQEVYKAIHFVRMDFTSGCLIRMFTVKKYRNTK